MKFKLVDPVQSYQRILKTKRKEYLIPKVKSVQEIKVGIPSTIQQRVIPIKTVLEPTMKKHHEPRGMQATKEWKEGAIQKAALRSSNYSTTTQAQSKARLESLLYLYHSCVDFVTYRNMDQKIENCLNLPDPKTLDLLTANARKRFDFDAEQSKADEEVDLEREEELCRILTGSLNLSLTVDDIKQTASKY